MTSTRVTLTITHQPGIISKISKAMNNLDLGTDSVTALQTSQINYTTSTKTTRKYLTRIKSITKKTLQKDELIEIISIKARTSNV